MAPAYVMGRRDRVTRRLVRAGLALIVLSVLIGGSYLTYLAFRPSHLEIVLGTNREVARFSVPREYLMQPYHINRYDLVSSFYLVFDYRTLEPLPDDPGRSSQTRIQLKIGASRLATYDMMLLEGQVWRDRQPQSDIDGLKIVRIDPIPLYENPKRLVYFKELANNELVFVVCTDYEGFWNWCQLARPFSSNFYIDYRFDARRLPEWRTIDQAVNRLVSAWLVEIPE